MYLAVYGATGYAGAMLIDILVSHPQVERLVAVSSSQSGARVGELFPFLSNADRLTERTGHGLAAEGGGRGVLEPIAISPDEAAGRDFDAVFSALPHLASAAVMEPFLGKVPVIDLSADFRLKSATSFEAAYGESQPRPDLQAAAVYGLPELHRERIAGAELIANPGCYPTATILALNPLVTAGGFVGQIHVAAMSGISGAGRKASERLLFSERTENVNAYAPGTAHRHVPEIAEQLNLATSRLSFVPHLVPIKQGIAVTAFVELQPGSASSARIESLYADRYADEPWVQFVGSRIPETRNVRGSNRCDIGICVEADTVMVFSVIDNLVKGAAGQAVQNFNIRFGFDEAAGLRRRGDL